MSINFGVMKTRCKLNANNLQSSSPFATYVPDYVNEGANRLILHAVAQDRRAVNCFPELKNVSWWDTLSTNNDNSVALPDDLLVLESATCTRSTTSYNRATQTEYPITECPDPLMFGYLSKTAKGWPTQWRRAGGSFEYWPTTSTTPTDYSTVIVLYGIAKEQALTSDSQTYTMNELWHPTVIKCATAILMDAMGLPDAQGWWDQVDRDVTATLNLLGLENLKNRTQIEIAGVPR